MTNPKITDRPKLYWGWWIVATGFVALVFHGGATTYVYSVMLPAMEEDLGWSRTLLVGVLTVSMFVTAVVGVLLGPIVDRYGARAAMIWGSVLGGTVLIMVGFVDTPWQYYALVGIGHGVARPAIESVAPRAVIAQWFIKRRPQAYAWFSGGRAVSGITLVPLIAVVIDVWGWRVGWVCLGILVWVVVVPMVVKFVQSHPNDLGVLPDGEQLTEVAFVSTDQHDSGTRPIEPVWTTVEALRSRTFWLLGFGLVFAMFPTAGIFVHLVPYYEEYGLSRGMAAFAVTLFASGAIIGRPVWALMAVRLGIRKSLISFGVGYGFSVTAFAVLPNAYGVVTAGIMVGLVNGGAAQLQAQAWPDYFGRRIVGALTGISFLLITPTIALSPLIAAVVHDFRGDYTLVWVAYGLAGFLAAAIFAMTEEPGVAQRDGRPNLPSDKAH